MQLMIFRTDKQGTYIPHKLPKMYKSIGYLSAVVQSKVLLAVCKHSLSLGHRVKDLQIYEVEYSQISGMCEYSKF